MDVYNLKSSSPKFAIFKYEFVRAPDYDDVIKHVYASPSLTKTYDSETGEEKKIKTTGNIGRHVCTYTVQCPDKEPPSIFYKNDKALTDIIYLMRLFSGRGCCLPFELTYFPACYSGMQLIPDHHIVAEIEKILTSSKHKNYNQLDLGVSLEYYFRSNSSSLLNFFTADLAIAWEVLSARYYALYWKPSAMEQLSLKDRSLLYLIGTSSKLLSSSRYANLIKRSIGEQDISLFDKAWFMMSDLGLLSNFDKSISQQRVRVFLGFLRAKIMHTGKMNEVKNGFSKRAHDYLVFAMRDLLSLVYLKLFEVNILDPKFTQLSGLLSNCNMFFSQKDPEYRGEKPFTESDSRFEKEWNDAMDNTD